MKYRILIITCFVLMLLQCGTQLHAQIIQQVAPSDSVQKIEILSNTRTLTFKTVNDTTKLTIISGDVKLRQGSTLFYADSCVINNNTNVFEAWGKVHINDSDTAHIYANHLRYLMREKKAFLDGKVRLTDGKGELTTPDLEYNMETNIGIYTHGGTVINKKTVLTSKEGVYYADLKDVYFKKDVVLKDPAYNIVTDSLLYNTATQTTRFIANTVITDSTGRVIETKEGYVNQQTGVAEFGQRPKITDKDIIATGNRIRSDDSTGIITIEGNAIVTNRKDSTAILGGSITRNKKTEQILATRKPLMIIKQGADSTFIAADTLFSARLSDRFGMDSIIVDSAKGIKQPAFNEKDSSNRYFEAYGHVRIFNDSLQATGDSLFYSLRDSIFRLFKDPVVWAQNSQITGDTILVFTKNKKADKVQAFMNGFMVNRIEDNVFNQVKSTRIDGWFTDGNIDSVRAFGSAQCIYYIQDSDSAYTGVNESKSDIMDIYFQDKELNKVVFRSEATGTIWPIRQKNPKDLLLPNFRWLEERRPKTKYEMFE